MARITLKISRLSEQKDRNKVNEHKTTMAKRATGKVTPPGRPRFRLEQEGKDKNQKIEDLEDFTGDEQ